MKIQSLFVGTIRSLNYNGKPVDTGIIKNRISGPVMLRKLNMDGDKQADLKVHGGLDKALYAYGGDAYSWWKANYPKHSYGESAFGENIVFDTLPEDKIFIGDLFQVGEAQVQVTQPRFPCFKLGIKYNDPQIIKAFMKSQRPGVYFRVIKEGMVAENNDLVLLTQEKAKVSVLEFFNLGQQEPDEKRLRAMLSLESLNAEWRENIEERLAKS